MAFCTTQISFWFFPQGIMAKPPKTSLGDDPVLSFWAWKFGHAQIWTCTNSKLWRFIIFCLLFCFFSLFFIICGFIGLSATYLLVGKFSPKCQGSGNFYIIVPCIHIVVVGRVKFLFNFQERIWYILRLLPTFRGQKNRFFFYWTKFKFVILS